MILGRANQAGLATEVRSKGPSTLKLVNTRGPGGVALELNTPAGIPPMRVNRAAWVRNLNADLLDGRQAWDLTRAAYGMADGWAMSPPANGHVVATTITVPNAGLLVMSGSFDTMTIHSPVYDHFDCFLKVDGAEVGGSRRTMDFQYDNTWDPFHGDYGTTEMNCATDGVARVNAGKHNVVLAIASNHAGAIRDAAVWRSTCPSTPTGTCRRLRTPGPGVDRDDRARFVGSIRYLEVMRGQTLRSAPGRANPRHCNEAGHPLAHGYRVAGTISRASRSTIGRPGPG